MLLLLCACLDAQTSPSFEVASISIDTSSDRPSGGYKNGRLIIHNQSLRSLIGAAYHVPNINVQGPPWLDEVRFDVAAKTDPSITEETTRLMLQTLLSEQLKLEIHRDERAEPAYSMVAASGGIKVREAPPDPEKPTSCSVMKRGEITCKSVPLASFASFLEGYVGDGLPVRDGTGLKGQFEIHLTWTQDVADSTLVEALEEQLGLKLRKQKLGIEYIVVDQVERIPVGQ